MSSLRAPAVVLLLGVITGAFGLRVVFSGANMLPVASAGYSSKAQDANDLKPVGCDGNLTNIVTGSGTINGTAGADLILGSSGDDVINGDNGADCILGGGGNDTINGDQDTDNIFGGPGVDVCTGGGQADTFPGGDCETEIP